MCQLLETIKYQNGQLHNLTYHEARMEYALLKNFAIKKRFDLGKLISLPKKNLNGLYKCRIVYTQSIEKIEFVKYKRKKISSIKLIEDEKISYSHKYENRSCITKHTKDLENEQEILIVKKGLLRDASYSNIALYNGKEWHTPSYPLLKGTKRSELLEKGIILSKKLKPKHLKQYTRISFINSMNNLNELYLDL